MFHVFLIFVCVVCIILNRLFNSYSCVCFSVCNGMPIAIMLQLVLVTKLSDYGMYKVGNVYAFLLVIGAQFCHWQCLLMGDLWLLVMKTVTSWCGTSQVVVVFHHWWGTARVSGHLLSGDLCILLFFSVEKQINLIRILESQECTLIGLVFLECYKHILSLMMALEAFIVISLLWCSREGSLLASGAADCTVKLWDVTTSMKGQKIEERYVQFHLVLSGYFSFKKLTETL